jgi:hypothetical protein
LSAEADSLPDDDTLKEILESAYDEVAGPAGLDEPDWAPLERALPYAECAGFMFMGYSDNPAGIRLYKHGITRRYLALDDRGRAYRYTPLGYRKTKLKAAIDEVFEGIEKMGATRKTPYDDAWRAAKDAKLAEAGYRVIRLDRVTDCAPGSHWAS